MSEMVDLGTVVAEYKPRSASPVLKLVLGIVVGIGSVFMVLYSIASSHVTAEDRPGVVILGALIGAFAWLMIESWLRTVGLRVQLFAGGIVHNQFGKTTSVRWEEIILVWQQVTKHYTNGIYTGTTHLYTLQKADTTILKLNDALNNIDQLGSKIQDEVTTRLLPLAISKYLSGNPVVFGDLSVSQSGISCNRKYVAWSEVSSVQLNAGILSVKTQGKRSDSLNIRVATIPNLWVALTLIARIRAAFARSHDISDGVAEHVSTYTNTNDINRGISAIS